jgi:hypothetical protein
MKNSAPGKAVDLTRRPSFSTAPSTSWSQSGSTLTSRIYFIFESSTKKKKSIRKMIRSAFNDVPRTIKILRKPEFVVVLVEDSEHDGKNEGVESTLVRNTSTIGHALEV